MEGNAEVNEFLESFPEASAHLKLKENDQLQSQSDGSLVISEDTGWSVHPSSTRSPESFLESFAGKDPLDDFEGYPVSEPPTSSSPCIFPGAIMEELTLKNATFQHCSDLADSSRRKGLWHNMARTVGGYRINSVPKELQRIGDCHNITESIMPQSLENRNNQLAQLSLTQLKAPHNIVHGDCQLPLNRPKILRESGFRQFLLKSATKGKGVAFNQYGPDYGTRPVIQSQDNVRVDDLKIENSESLHKPAAKNDEMSLLSLNGTPTDSNVRQDETSLRDWFKQKCRASNNSERFRLFEHVLKLVDASHSQGRALQHLKPSYFTVSSLGCVKYTGSVSAQMETHLQKKRLKEYTEFYSSSHKALKYQRVGEKNQTFTHHGLHSLKTCLHGSLAEKVQNDSVRSTGFNEGFSEKIQSADFYHTSEVSVHQNAFRSCSQEPESGILNLEDRWYASPEKLDGNACPLSSNIYSLGVLFFEIFSFFEIEEVHIAAMLNLQHRILPSKFLSECPKEAGFCLWLLHPDPSSRPKSREILSSNLISECSKNISSRDHSPASIDKEDAEADLLLHFLSSSKDQIEIQAANLAGDIQCLEADLEEVERRHLSRFELLSGKKSIRHSQEMSNQIKAQESLSSSSEERLMGNIDQLKHAYFSVRSNVHLSETNSTTRSDVGVLKSRDKFYRFQDEAGMKEESRDRLGAFFEGLCKYARYSKLEVRGSLRNVDILNSANVVCSLSFDRDEDYFAAAGVSKKIKIFEFDALLNESVDVHYPLIEMSSRSKLSCVCWNNYIKSYLASTDYDGVVQLWDASTGQWFAQYAEHEKRAWSVDFSSVDPTKLASGSDDCSVKLWSIKERNCIDSIRNVANVCCVQFSPYSSHLLAFGSADYKIYCYDLRNTRTSWCTLSGHGKTVSYVKFVDSETLVSASTDNTLKLWDLKKSSSNLISTNACSLTLAGHTNEKNFVGLTVFDGYIACGSETNEVYAYHKSLPMPIMAHKFGSVDPITGHETGDDNGQFVSSLCFRTKSSMVLAANSSGSLKILQPI